MAGDQKTIFVYDDFSEDQPVLMGNLYVDVNKEENLRHCER